MWTSFSLGALGLDSIRHGAVYLKTINRLSDRPEAFAKVEIHSTRSLTCCD
jgi:hypothetical protein